MNFLEIFRISVRALNANKVRALLTMLGVIIGVASVILLVSIGTGVRNDVVGQLQGLGANTLWVMPGNMEEMMSGGGGMSASASPMASNVNFTMQDARELSSHITVGKVVPVVESGARASLGNKQMGVSLMASDENGDLVRTADLAEGRSFNRSEVSAASRVVIIGFKVAEEYFPGRSALGQVIRIEGETFEVIGVNAEVGGGLTGGSMDSVVDMPITTALQLLDTNDLTYIGVAVDDPDDMQVARNQIRQAMRPKFGSDFSIIAQEQMLGILGTLLDTLTYMLAGIASISLLVGGIGIMNIMLVSVTERTREIGIRKAVGARTYDIMAQFVTEAILLSVLGGLLGIAIGALGSWAMSSVVSTSVTPWAVALAFMFSVGVGVFFGVYPAWKASKLDPIEALRYE